MKRGFVNVKIEEPPPYGNVVVYRYSRGRFKKSKTENPNRKRYTYRVFQKQRDRRQAT